jgi:LysR family transcriptional regulator, hydrogen peroxide-inducible genes activator
MTSLSLKQLRYFDALAEQGHFGRAAEVSAISQPALSLQIKELETALGAPLVERGPRRIRLTPLGEAVAARARDILAAVDELADLARLRAGPLAGPLRLGVIPTVAPYLLPALIRHLADAHPGLDLRPREAVTSRLTQDLRAGRLDAALVALPLSEPSLTETPLFTEEFVLVRPASQADDPVPDARTLGTMRLLLLEEGHCFRDQALSFCSLTAAAAREVMEGSSLSTLVQMVGAGIGVTLIPQMAVAIEAPRAAVALARLPAPRPQRTIGLVWRRSSALAGPFAGLAEVVSRVAAARGPLLPVGAAPSFTPPPPARPPGRP